jgi:phenylacetate-coenzyme A ligase PaaK-like adenylate-forming protein
VFSENELIEKIFSMQTEDDFNKTALSVFYSQYQQNIVYRQWVDNLNINPALLGHYSQIPFLPISFFKTHSVVSFEGKAEQVFSSSGTSMTTPSQHFVKDISLYRRSFGTAFQLFYQNPTDWVIMALLPSYLEREGSSLILMVESLIRESNNPLSGFYLYDHESLFQQLQLAKKQSKKVMLLGVSFALLDFAEQFQIDFPELYVMETGGMKGKRSELLREELHAILKKAFGVRTIHSEYGMTELLSQSYSKGEGVFSCPPWMKILIRDPNDPLSYMEETKTGGINVIDLCNLYSCAFIATQDLGKKLDGQMFEIIGRFDHSDVRGCNLLVF